MDASLQEWRQIGRGEHIETIGVSLSGAVVTEEFVIEEETYLVHSMIGCQIQGVEQIGLTIGAKLCQRDLRTGHDHRLGQVLQHE